MTPSTPSPSSATDPASLSVEAQGVNLQRAGEAAFKAAWHAACLQRIGEAAFAAGWHAAYQTIADMCARAGAHPQMVKAFRDLSAEPPNLVVGEGKTPPGHETVMVQTFPRKGTDHE